MVRRRLLQCIAACLIGWTLVAMPVWSPLFAQDKNVVRVIPNHTTVVKNETFQVKFMTEADGVGDPDWSPLDNDFRVLSKKQGLRKTVVNGVARSVHEWTVQLQPRRSGRLHIPVLKFGAVKSRATLIQVKPPPPAKTGKAAEKFFVEVSAQPKNPYVQAQVMFTLRVFMLHDLRGSVTPPKSGSKAIVESLGEARNYRTNRNGKNYQVYERRYLIYPQNSGDVRINPVNLTGSYIHQRRQFSVNKKSRALTLKVRQVPDSFPGKFWLPAEKFAIKENWSADPATWRAGEPLTRTLNLEARGLLARQLPAVELSQGDGFRSYTEPADFKDRRAKDTIIGTRQQAAVLIPTQAGAYTLPAIKIPWWNTRSDRLEYAQLLVRQLTIRENTFGSLMVDEPPPPDIVERDAVLDVGIRPNNAWFWVSIILLFGWLITAALRWRGQGVYRLWRSWWQRKQTLRERRKCVQQACLSNDAAAAKDALMQWAAQVWRDDAPTSLGQVGDRCRSSGGEVLNRQIMNLERALYAAGGQWQGGLLWSAFDETCSAAGFVTRTKQAENTDELEPLHRL